jgi:uncharacterized FlaG/YvyC family protein
MTDNPVSNVTRVELQNAQVAQTQAAQVSVQAAKEVAAVQPVDEIAKGAASENSPQQPQPSSPALSGRQTNLKFQVDKETNQVTIMIVDRATNKVIATIPPDKIKDIPPGDLLRYQI